MSARALQSNNWMQIKKIIGLEDFTTTYKEVVAGQIKPHEGIIVKLKDD
jgi:hypothetical protein